jgi:chemotaxis protein histidine kinase CheA
MPRKPAKRKPAKKRKTTPKSRASKSVSTAKKTTKSSTSKTAAKNRTSPKFTTAKVGPVKSSTASKPKAKPEKKSTATETPAKKQTRSKAKKATGTQNKAKSKALTQSPKKTTSSTSKSKTPQRLSRNTQTKSSPTSQKPTAPRTAKTVKTAFKYFRNHTVDLSPAVVQKGRRSQTFLVKQIKQLAKRYPDFPKLKGNYVPFGSFSRNVKICPLNDIDLLILLNGSDTTIRPTVLGSSMVYTVTLKKTASCLAPFADDQGQVNSTKILNRIKTYLTHITHYKKAATNKRMQAVTFQLKSYPWIFDIVPAIPVYSRDRVTHYLIPDGHGDWIRTNPKIDAKNMATANKTQQGKLLAIMRLLKYWNNRTHKPRLPSYYFETIVIQTFRHAAPIKSDTEALQYFFNNASTYLMASCPDPKNLGDNLDRDISRETKQKITKALKTAAQQVGYAIRAESKNDPKLAISWWCKIFGREFPTYG